MSTIAYRDGVIAADTRVVQGQTIIGTVVKIVRRDSDGALCGGAGALNWVQAFHRWFLAGEEGAVPEPDDGDYGMIIRKGDPEIEMFEVGGSFDFAPNYAAIGSGRDFALAVMSVGGDAASAVQTAMMFDPGTGGDLMVLSHDQPEA